jgi:hypothetical protein
MSCDQIFTNGGVHKTRVEKHNHFMVKQHLAMEGVREQLLLVYISIGEVEFHLNVCNFHQQSNYVKVSMFF